KETLALQQLRGGRVPFFAHGVVGGLQDVPTGFARNQPYGYGLAQSLHEAARIGDQAVGVHAAIESQDKYLVFGNLHTVRIGSPDHRPAGLERKTRLASYGLVRQAAKGRLYRSLAMYSGAGRLVERICPALCVQPAPLTLYTWIVADDIHRRLRLPVAESNDGLIEGKLDALDLGHR